MGLGAQGHMGCWGSELYCFGVLRVYKKGVWGRWELAGKEVGHYWGLLWGLAFGQKRSEDEEYAMAVRDFKKFFKRRGRFVRQPQNDKKTFQRSRDEKNGKSDRKCFRCGDPNHLIGKCPKPPKEKNQRAFVGGSWSDSGKEDDEKVNNETCLVAQASSEIITKNKRLKATRDSLEKEISILKEKLSTLENYKFEKSTHCLNEMLNNQKPFGEKLGLGFNSLEVSSSGTKEIEFVKAQKKVSLDGGPINMGGPFNVQAAPKKIWDRHQEPHMDLRKICIGVDLEPNKWIKDSGCSKHMTGNQKLFSSYKAYNGGNVIFGSNLRGNIIGKVNTSTYILNRILIRAILGKTPYELLIGRKPTLDYFRVSGSKYFILNTKDYLTKFDPKSYEGIFLGYSQNSKAYIILNKHTRKVKESLNMTFDETPPPSKTPPLVDDDLDEEAIKVIEKNLENDIMDETLEINEIVNIKESRNHPIENVMGNLNQKTLISQAPNQSNLFCFISTIEPKNVNEALTDDSWIVAMQEELNQFIANDVWELVPQPRNMTIIETKWVFRNKLDENGIVSRNKARLVAQGYNQQEGIDYDKTYASVARLESIRILLAYACALDFKLFQMDVKSAFLNGFINKEVYVAQPPGFIEFEKPDHVYKFKKALYSLKQAPKAWPDIMFSVCLCACFQEATKTSHLKVVKRILRYIKGTTHLGLCYPKGTGIETVVYADSDLAGDYVDRKSTNGICTFVGSCLTSWFSKKQTGIAISTTEAEYVSAEKACEQALWMKQDLINYEIRLDNVPIMCDNKGAIDLSKNPMQHFRTKHIKIRHHFLRDNLQKGYISIEKVPFVDNIAEILTKPLKRHFVVNVVIQSKSFSLTLEEFGQILKIPIKGHVAYTDMWLLDYLSLSAPSRGRYKTTPLSPQVIKSLIQIPRQSQATRTKNKKTIIVDENEILIREIQPHMKPWVYIIHENAICLGGHKDHVSACLCHMLYFIEFLTPYNLEFFVLKRMEKTQNKPKELLPYGMLLSRLFKHVMSVFLELAIDRYLSFDRVMHPPLLIMSERRDRIMVRKDLVSQMLVPPPPPL
nr:retrovirus-related Pol polyprotein from transposon TNT 1-94 [Tanacetum cinerariifolium]